jgi:hypothetical protein
MGGAQGVGPQEAGDPAAARDVRLQDVHRPAGEQALEAVGLRE